MRVRCWASIVMTPPPSITVSTALVGLISAVMGMVAAPPQLKVTIPPCSAAALNSASVQVPGPVPTTVVGLVTSTAWIDGVHVEAVPPPVPPVPPPPVPLPPVDPVLALALGAPPAEVEVEAPPPVPALPLGFDGLPPQAAAPRVRI